MCSKCVHFVGLVMQECEDIMCFKCVLFIGFVIQECEDIIVLHLGYLSYQYYVITVHIYGIETVELVDMVFTVRILALTKAKYYMNNINPLLKL